MLHLQIDPHSGVPVYRQMMEQVRYYLASGLLKPGDRLPSIREMAKALSVNPTTVVKAYTELEHGGIIERKHGKGVFIAKGIKPLPRKEVEAALRRQARQLAVEASQLGASAELVLRLLKQEIEALNKEKP
jgi:GntR family transcriptional regulator